MESRGIDLQIWHDRRPVVSLPPVRSLFVFAYRRLPLHPLVMTLERFYHVNLLTPTRPSPQTYITRSPLSARTRPPPPNPIGISNILAAVVTTNCRHLSLRKERRNAKRLHLPPNSYPDSCDFWRRCNQ